MQEEYKFSGNSNGLVLLTMLAWACGFSACGQVDTTPEQEERDEVAVVVKQAMYQGTAFNPSDVEMVSLSNGCSGSLLENDWVLTASHCINTYTDVAFDGDNGANDLDGKIIRDIDPSDDDIPVDAAVDGDGRLLVAANDHDGNIIVSRLKKDGSLDTSFNSTGYRVIDTSFTMKATSVVVDGVGRIVIGGYAYYYSSYQFMAIRLTSTGQMDTSFSGDGIRIPGFGSSTAEHAYGVIVDASNNIILGGRAYVNSEYQFAAARLLASNGDLDTSFDDDGKVLVDFISSSSESAYDIAIDSYDGSIYLAGVATPGGAFGDGATSQFAIAKLTSSGLPDTTFGDGDGNGVGDGKAYVPFTSGSAYVRAWASAVVVDQSNGDVFLGGQYGGTSDMAWAIAKFDWSSTDMDLDLTFGVKKYHQEMVSSGERYDLRLADMAISGGGLSTSAPSTPDHRVVVVGSAVGSDGDRDMVIGRIMPDDGALDTDEFQAERGFRVANYSSLSGDSVAVAVAIDAHSWGADGEIFLVGHHNPDDYSDDVVLAVRYWEDFLVSPLYEKEGYYQVTLADTTNAQNSYTRSASTVFNHPTHDVALLKLAVPMPVDGSTSGFSRSIYSGSDTSLHGETVTCYGFGGGSTNGGMGSFTIVADSTRDPSDADAKKIYLPMNSLGQYFCRGDSGGGCIDSAGNVLSVHKASYYSDSGCDGTYDVNNPPVGIANSAVSFRNWALSTMSNN